MNLNISSYSIKLLIISIFFIKKNVCSLFVIYYIFRERFVGEKIALFSDVVELCLELNMRMVIDIKEQQPKVCIQ